MAETATSTESLCPVCLAVVPATRSRSGQDVVLSGSCPEHGPWGTTVWRGSPTVEEWTARCDDPLGATCDCSPGASSSSITGCAPAVTCTAVVEATRRCNLRCPVCFAESSSTTREPDPPMDEVESLLRDLHDSSGPVNVQLSGGEPTVRADLPSLVARAARIGFPLLQLNSNGILLADDPDLARRLAEAGLDSVFMQFDGLSDDSSRTIRGRPLLEMKRRAIERCADAGLSVVLVPTVIPGVNDDELGAILRFAAEWSPSVRGVHFQPVTYVGRHLRAGAKGLRRLTLPETLALLEAQSAGQVRAEHFRPSPCEHALCSFRARYWVNPVGRLTVVGRAAEAPGRSDHRESPARRAVRATSRQWGSLPARPAGKPQDDLDRFLHEADRILTISGMLFQDAWSIDLRRVERCCVHAVVPGRGRVPFCLWNLTAADGKRLYPRTELLSPR